MSDAAHTAPPASGRPVSLGPEREHYWLVLRMAQTIGVDPAGEMAAGRLTQADWAGVVHRCRGCDWADGCRAWLHDHPQAASAPSPCRNAVRLDGMREARQDSEGA